MVTQLETETAVTLDGSSRQERRTNPIPLSLFIKDLYPETKRTQIPNFINGLVYSLEPICLKDPLNENALDSFAIIRGSAIKRHVFGTPCGYWDVSRLYSNSGYLLMEEDPLTQRVTQKLAQGPRDLDVRYRFAQDKTPEDLRQRLEQSLLNQGFIKEGKVFKKGKYQATINAISIGGDFAPPRTFFEVNFSLGDKFIIRVDFGELAKEEQNLEDFRFSGYSSGIEAFATGNLQKTRDTLYVTPEPRLALLLEEVNGIKIVYSTNFANLFFGILKGAIGNRVFWPARQEETPYSYNQLIHQFKDGGYLDPSFWEKTVNPNEPDEQKKLEKRQEEIIRECLLYLTYDPFLFLSLAYETHLLQYLPIGKIIKNRGDFIAVMTKMEEQLSLPTEGRVSYEVLPETTLPFLSNAYKSNVLRNFNANITHAGPYMLIRALKRTNLISPETPENLASVVSLFNPLVARV